MEESQYEFDIDGSLAKIVYETNDNKIYLLHTEVPREFQGRGIGKTLVESVLEDIEKNGLTLVPLCSFVSHYVQNNPKWKKLL